jgi:hypothetical protein
MSGAPAKKKRSNSKKKTTLVAERAFKVTPFVTPTKSDGDESASSSSIDAEDVQFFEENRGFSGEKRDSNRLPEYENADEAQNFFFFFFPRLCLSNASN